jgi:hypothetical protein
MIEQIVPNRQLVWHYLSDYGLILWNFIEGIMRLMSKNKKEYRKRKPAKVLIL